MSASFGLVEHGKYGADQFTRGRLAQFHGHARRSDAGTAAGDDVDGAGRVGHVEVSLREARAARAGEWPRMVLSPRVVVDRRRAWESGPETFGRG